MSILQKPYRYKSFFYDERIYCHLAQTFLVTPPFALYRLS